MKEVHPILPVFDAQSELLILGSFPSVKSRESGFFYGHPQNRFWRVIAAICGAPLPTTIGEKKALLLTHHIAVWDVIHSCEITGSADSSIKNAVPNDIESLLKQTSITRIFTNGKKADALYARYIEPRCGIKAVCLPSTSPANAAWSTEKLTEYWFQALKGNL